MMSELSAQNLAITAWSLAALETRDVSFFKQAADPFVLRLQECKAQELNNMLWAYATVNFRLPWLFLKSANHAISLGLAEFKTHELSIMLWAHGTAGVCNHEFFDQVVDEILGGRGIHSCAPREIANSAWAYSTIIGRCHVPWMTAVAQYSRSHVNEFDMQGIGNILWSFANVSTYSEALLHKACEETARRCYKDEASHNVAQVLSAMQAAGLQEVRLCEAAIDLFLRRGFVGGIGAREFLILGNAALPMANILHERWTNLKALLEEHIFRPLTEAIPPRHGMADWSQVETCISQLDIDHLGVGFTATFLKNIGVLGSVQVHQSSHIGCSWIQEAAQACALERERAIQAGAEENAPAEQQKLVRQLDKVNKREIVAWVRYQISLDGLKHAEHGRAFSWRLEAEMSQTRVAQLLKPMMTKSRMAPNMIGEHDRSGHAERCALLQVASDWLQTGPERGLEVHGEMWWSVLKSANRPDAEASKGDTESFGQAPKDVLACLASVLLYLNGDLDDGLPQVSELAIAIQEELGSWECGISSISGEQQDAHEALVKLLEAVYVGLSKRKVAAFQRLKPWDPMRPYWLGSPNFLHFCEASEALQHFQDLFEGVLEERRLCRSCGLVRVESCPSKQAFRCLSLDLIQMNHPHFSSVNLVNLLGSSYGGKPTEEIDGLVCDRCSLEASLRRALLDSGASIFAARACHRFAALLEAHAAGARLPDMEGLEALRPVAAPPCVLKRRSHVRSFRIRVAPRIFTFHMRRLIFGPFGFIKVSNPVRYPEILNDLGLSAGYGLCSVMSHLGHATEGHFITHRVSWHDEVNYIDCNCNCNAFFASQPKCQVFGVLESR
ncbi:unnamed protein product [Cladocopium goreaui]|uniref:Ubiquitin carboxyl-terminal hydrolase 16 (Deubiquitinating enzyme 16) (Ubiquitin thioesterase 16) (Ubiquitin-specific-processing protease 16) n=1 Tax=Cladocopium goreaui TaxID=2562237 RepID=A0A9P1CJI0_9DINO|nr:unnamed protein product [Cladocopium goreaui]